MSRAGIVRNKSRMREEKRCHGQRAALFSYVCDEFTRHVNAPAAKGQSGRRFKVT
jgi:hypothetical protein